MADKKTMKDKNTESEEQKVDMKKEVISTVIYLACICLAVFLILHFVGQRTVVNGDSMCNTLTDGESLIMDKLSYRFSDPERYDIVVFPGVEEEDGSRPYYIKRIIGLPGETVQIIDGKVYIDGEELTSDVYGITDYIDYAGIAETPLTLSDDEYFCMGDNRPVSRDCRYEELGPVTRDELQGKIWIRIWPLSKFGHVDNGN